MSIERLYEILIDLNREISDTGIQGTLTNLSQSLMRLHQGQLTPQMRQQIINQVNIDKQKLFATINTFIPASLTTEDAKIYEAIGAYSLFGYDGQQRLEKMTSNLQNNPGEISEFNKYQVEINQVI